MDGKCMMMEVNCMIMGAKCRMNRKSVHQSEWDLQSVCSTLLRVFQKVVLSSCCIGSSTVTKVKFYAAESLLLRLLLEPPFSVMVAPASLVTLHFLQLTLAPPWMHTYTWQLLHKCFGRLWKHRRTMSLHGPAAAAAAVLHGLQLTHSRRNNLIQVWS